MGEYHVGYYVGLLRRVIRVINGLFKRHQRVIRGVIRVIRVIKPPLVRATPQLARYYVTVAQTTHSHSHFHLHLHLHRLLN